MVIQVIPLVTLLVIPLTIPVVPLVIFYVSCTCGGGIGGTNGTSIGGSGNTGW